MTTMCGGCSGQANLGDIFSVMRARITDPTTWDPAYDAANAGGRSPAFMGMGVLFTDVYGKSLDSRSLSPEKVMAIQQAFQGIGIYSGPIDGKWTEAMKASTRTFQKSAGLTVDGGYGPQTDAALFGGTKPPQMNPVDPPPGILVMPEIVIPGDVPGKSATTLSTGMKIGIGVGALALVVGAYYALGSK